MQKKIFFLFRFLFFVLFYHKYILESISQIAWNSRSVMLRKNFVKIPILEFHFRKFPGYKRVMFLKKEIRVILARGKFKFKLFLNDLWYEPETLWLFLTFTRDYFAEKEMKKILNFQGENIFLYRGIAKK